MIGNINQIQSNAFDNISEFEWFKANKDKGACMCDGYCTKPVIDGKICDRLLKRQKCYTCNCNAKLVAILQSLQSFNDYL